MTEAELLKKEQKEPSAENRLTRIRRLIMRFQTLRVIVQFLFFLLFFGLFLGLGPWPVLFPVIGLLGVPTKTVGEAFGSLQYMLYLVVPPWLALTSVFVAAIVVNRAFCAWVCPFGLVQDILNLVKKRHTRVSLRTHNQMIYVKYLVLAASVLVSGTLAASVMAGIGSSYKNALGPFAVAPFNTLSPADTLFAVVPRTVFDARYAINDLLAKPSGDFSGAIFSSLASVSALFWVRIVVLALTFALVIYVPRGWCRYVCPQAAFSALFSRFSFLGLTRHPVRCSRAGCRDCVEVCPMMVPILDQPWEKFTHPECIMCLKCVDACSMKAIKPKFP
jgi:ferredoxin-type protein NapH